MLLNPVFDMIRPGRTPMIYHSHAENGNRYVTDAVFACYGKYVSFTKERPCIATRGAPEFNLALVGFMLLNP
jgi:hypothetical protein